MIVSQTIAQRKLLLVISKFSMHTSKLLTTPLPEPSRQLFPNFFIVVLHDEQTFAFYQVYSWKIASS